MEKCRLLCNPSKRAREMWRLLSCSIIKRPHFASPRESIERCGQYVVLNLTARAAILETCYCLPLDSSYLTYCLAFLKSHHLANIIFFPWLETSQVSPPLISLDLPIRIADR